MPVQLEVCIDNLRSAIAAKKGGANRLEVCGPLCVGGTTPGAALIEQCVALGEIAVMVMIRPHCGGFEYDAIDVETMLQDIEFAKSAGANGVVFGALTKEGRVDVEVCRRLAMASDGLEITFHRAFDVAADPLEALDHLIELRIHRVLTSGQKQRAVHGASMIRRLVEHASGRISILPGSGINADNVSDLILQTGVGEIHASCSIPVEDPGYSIDFGGQGFTTNVELVRRLRAAVDCL